MHDAWFFVYWLVVRDAKVNYFLLIPNIGLKEEGIC
jgi:hypothetical protein